jgi:hypothetical protein
VVVVDIFFAILVGVVLSALFSLFLRRRAGFVRLFWFFLVVFLAAWAGGIWLPPFGPSAWGVAWLPFLLVGLAAAAALALWSRRPPPAGRQETLELLADMEEERELEEATYFTLTLFFWILLLALVVVVVLRYVV